MDDLTLYDADAAPRAVRVLANMMHVAEWIDAQCAARGLGFASRTSCHRQHGRLIQRGIVALDALKQALTQYMDNGCAQSARNAELF